MFLNLIETDEEKELFMKMAIIVALSNKEDESFDITGEEIEEEDDEDDDEENYFRRNWSLSRLEHSMLMGYINELGLNETSDDEISDYSSEFLDVLEEMLPVLSKISKLTEEEKRIEIVDKFISEGIDWEDYEDIEISLQTKRVMIIELLGIALVDGEYAPLEKFVVEKITKRFGFDPDELEEMEDYVTDVRKVYNSGLEIIQN
ncbi:MAG: hypothetical protein B6229_03745 [Spirochaetaceae bacterium 4572_7]|nr:MAG: hypothetical protein B6229_03745 [Spirochaetaceae bacterium 4572_7]